jgi:SAM-dependent methyltransferase
MNKHGYGDADPKRDETIWEFIEEAVNLTKLTDQAGQPATPTKIVVDIGGGYGDVALRIVQGGGRVLYIDKAEEHEMFVAHKYNEMADSPTLGQLKTVVGSLPYPTSHYAADLSTRMFLNRELQNEQIVAVGSFSSMMYLSDTDTTELLEWVYNSLPSQGKFYITGVSAYSNVFPGYEPIHEGKMELFRENPKAYPFPGYVRNVYFSQEMKKFVTKKYKKSYPNDFHFLDPEVLSFHAKKQGFIVEEAKFYRRDYPERLRYRGSNPDVGEMVRVILKKP